MCVCVCVGGGGWMSSTVNMKESLSSKLAGLHYSYYFVSAGCGGVLSGLAGTLQYPHSGSIEYSHNINCAWLIITNTTKVLQLNFTKFDIEHSPNCEFDFLQVQYPPPQFRNYSVWCWFSCDLQFLKFVIWCIRFILCFKTRSFTLGVYCHPQISLIALEIKINSKFKSLNFTVHSSWYTSLYVRNLHLTFVYFYCKHLK